MGNMKEGDFYECGRCGLEVTITKACDEEKCDLMCCGQQLGKSSPEPDAYEENQSV